MNQVFTRISRSKKTESIHKIKLLVKNQKGKTLFSTGNDKDFIYPRSAIKIFQAIPFVSSKATDIYKLSSKAIALSCSSHRGESYHLRELEKWLKKIKIKKSNLKCGSHYPLNTKATEKLLRCNGKINQLYNNCAGKHLAMILKII